MSSTLKTTVKINKNKYFALLSLLLVTSLSLAGCDRLGRAPEDLDYTPTANAEQLITPTAIPLETDRQAQLEADIEAIENAVPARISAGGAEWSFDANKGFFEPPNITNGVGTKFTITDASGGLIEITYVAFDTSEDAKNHYNRMHDEVRGSILRAGETRNNFPQPNKFNAQTGGSVSIMIVEDTYFIEVFVLLFTGQSNPLVSTALQAVNIFNTALEVPSE